MKYAATTTVSPDRSKQEIETILQRYGADQFMYGWTPSGAIVGFRMNNRIIRFVLQLPEKDDPRFQTTPSGRSRSNAKAQNEAWDQECRRLWRALALVIKAKMEAVESGICTFENEFLANTVLPDNTLVGDWVADQVDRAYQSGNVPKLLGPGSK